MKAWPKGVCGALLNLTCIRQAAAGICLLKCFCLCFCWTFRAKPEPRMPCKKKKAHIIIIWRRNKTYVVVASMTYSGQGKEGHCKDGKTGSNCFPYPSLRHFIPVPYSGHCHLNHERKKKCMRYERFWKTFGFTASTYEGYLPLPTTEHQHSWKILWSRCCPLRLFLPGTQSTSRKSDPRIRYTESWSVPGK